MAKTKKCEHFSSMGCRALKREDCPKKRLPRESSLFCHKVPVKVVP